MKKWRILVLVIFVLLALSIGCPAKELTFTTGDEKKVDSTGATGFSVLASYSNPDEYTLANDLVVDSSSYDLSSESCGGSEKQITFGSLKHVNPRVSESKVVYEEWNSGISVIGMYDLNSGGLFPVSPGIQKQTSPDASGRYIVYEQAGPTTNPVTNIYTFDLQSQTASPISKTTSNQDQPAISGRFVVWQDWRTGNSDIWMADLNAGTSNSITKVLSDQLNPDISGSKIVWEDWRNGNADIFMYDIETGKEVQLTDNPLDQKKPRISGNLVVWEDNRNGGSDIYVMNLENRREVQLTYESGKELSPDVSGALVVWEDWRNGNADIYLLDLISGRIYRVSSHNSDQTNPSIYGYNVVWQDYRTGTPNIFLYTTSGPGPISQKYQFYGTASACSNPAQSGMTVSALVDGKVKGSIIVGQPGSYGQTNGPYLEVPFTGTDYGKLITFKVNEYQADQTITIGSGGVKRVELIAPCDPPTDSYVLSGAAIINNKYAPAGTVITARIADQLRGQTTVSTSGKYSGLTIPITKNDLGRQITFYASLGNEAYKAGESLKVGDQVIGIFDLTFGTTPPFKQYTFSGRVTIDGQTAPVGTLITAKVSNKARGQVSLSSPGTYSGLNIPIYSDDNGRSISFTASYNGNSYVASQTVVIGEEDTVMMMSTEVSTESVSQGISKKLDLTFSAASQAKYKFWGSATLDGNPMPVGKRIQALIDGQIRGELQVITLGAYGSQAGPYLEVILSSSDIGKSIHFQTDSGAIGDQNQLIVSGMTVQKNIYFTSTPSVTVDFTASPLQGSLPLNVKFNAKAGGNPKSYYWDFGDGVTSKDMNPTHTYTQSGVYSVGLMVTFWNGQSKAVVKQDLIMAGTLAPPDAKIWLNPGWNFVTVPKMLAEGQNTAQSVFGNIDVGGHSVFIFNPRNKAWNTVSAGIIINPLEAFWIYSTKKDALYLYFASDALQIPPTKRLLKGWNTFGVTTLNTVPAYNALLSVKDAWVYVIGFESGSQRYQSTILNVPDSYKAQLNPGYGYWIYMNQDGDLAGIGV